MAGMYAKKAPMSKMAPPFKKAMPPVDEGKVSGKLAGMKPGKKAKKSLPPFLMGK